jgi:hypothetical protein
MLTRLLVLPPGLRPLFPIHPDTKSPFDIGDDPLFVTSDINALYRWLLSTNLDAQQAHETGNRDLAAAASDLLTLAVDERPRR